MAGPLRRRRPMGEINVVPYIDVMLVLLIIFMVTAPLLTEGVQVDLPEAAARPVDPAALAERPPIVVSIDREGRVFINSGETPGSPVSEQILQQRVTNLLRETPQVPIFVKGDQSVPYGRVIETMSVLQRAGATKIGFLTEPLEERRASQ
ncbi:MAG: protein TolR [Steroidobacteraceae bacterium]